MTTFQLAAIVLVLTAGLAYVNTRLLKLPSSVGIMAAAMLGSLALIGLSALRIVDADAARRWIGVMVMLVPLSASVGVAAALGVVIALGARAASVAFSLLALRPFGRHPAHSTKLLTWGGLRGGISIALALALPASRARDVIVVMTYTVVAFAILVQGLTFGALLRRLGVCGAAPVESH